MAATMPNASDASKVISAARPWALTRETSTRGVDSSTPGCITTVRRS